MPRAAKNADQRPTFTSLVFAHLTGADDFVTIAQLMACVPELTFSRATSVLDHLRKSHAAAFMVDAGVTYWYATPEEDLRKRTMDERCREEPGRRVHKSAVRQPRNRLPKGT